MKHAGFGQSQSYCPSKMQKNYAEAPAAKKILSRKNSTKIKKHTDDTFSDLVKKNIKDNSSSNVQSSIASK